MFTNEEQARYAVELSEALERLEQNADFKRVIKDAYLDESAKGIILTLAYATENQVRERINKLIGISNFQLFLAGVKANGIRAHEALNDPSVFEQGE